MYKGQQFSTYHPVEMIRENLMVLLIQSLVLLSLVGVSWEQSDSCVYEGQQVTGEFTMPGFCLLYRCIPGQGVTAVGCGIRIPPEGCFIEHPDTKNYPECCYTKVVCPEANSINSDQTQQTLASFNISSVENLGYPKLINNLSPAPFTASTSGMFRSSQPKFSTERPQVIKMLTPPSPGVATPVFRPKATKKRPSSGFTEPQSIYSYSSPREETIGPYYYRK